MHTLLYTKLGRAVVWLFVVLFLFCRRLLAFAEVFDPPTISNPNLFTSHSSVPDVDQTTGAFVHRVPLDIPPAATASRPILRFNTTASSSTMASSATAGRSRFRTSSASIKTGSDRLYTDNYFMSSLGGELATTSTRERVSASLRRRSLHQVHVLRTTRGSRTTRRERSTRSAHRRPRSCTRRRRRAMCTAGCSKKSATANNNYITYCVRARQRHQSNLSEAHHRTPATAQRTASSRSTSRAQRAPIRSRRTSRGFCVRTTDRITEIKASVSGSWVRKYALSYTTGQNGTRSLLASVQLTGRDDLGTELTMPATAFMYSSTTPGYTTHTNPRRVECGAHVAETRTATALPI